jgi:hypothetical protein
MLRRWLPPPAGALLLLAGTPSALPVAAAPQQVYDAQQISQDTLACPATDATACELDTQVEPHIAVNPDDPNNIVGVFQQGRYKNGGSVDPGFATSFDDGRTWPARGSAPGLTVSVAPRTSPGPHVPFERGSDPVAAFDRKHQVVFLQTIAVSIAGCSVYCDSAVMVNVSSDKGRTFAPPVVIEENNDDPSPANFLNWTFNDKNWMVVDNTPTSPHYGRAYSVWDQALCVEPSCTQTANRVVVKVSDDGGATWSPKTVSTPNISAQEQPNFLHEPVGTQPIVLPNGDIVVLYQDAQVGLYTFYGTMHVIRSSDGGATWSTPKQVDTLTPVPLETAGLRAPDIVSADTDGKTIFAVWQDGRNSVGMVSNDILMSRSADGGNTWSTSVDLTPGEATLDHFTPAIAAMGGKVYLTYRTRMPGNVFAGSPFNSVDAVYRVVDGATGATTAGPGSLYSTPTNTDFAAYTTQGAFKFLGDYAAIAVSPQSAHAIWCQAQNFAGAATNPDNTHIRAFSARVVLAATAPAPSPSPTPPLPNTAAIGRAAGSSVPLALLLGCGLVGGLVWLRRRDRRGRTEVI